MSRDILLHLIDAVPDQPRTHFDQGALDGLAQSMAANGLAVPILVRPVGERFIIVHGERRYRAASLLQWETILADVRDIPLDDVPWLALVENIQRADLSPIEEARAYRAHLDTGITQQELGKRIGKTQSYIASKLRFLKLEPEIQQALTTGDISEGHAKQLLRVDNSTGRLCLFADIQSLPLTVRETAEKVDMYEHMLKIEQKMHQSIIDVRDNLRAVQALLTPEQFQGWCIQEAHLDNVTAHDFLNYEGPPWDRVTERMMDHFIQQAKNHAQHHVT